jgi:hypothetical protein
MKMLTWQLYLKLTKFTRRSTTPRAFGQKLVAGYSFLRDMSYYNLEVMQRSRRCLKLLAEENIEEVLVYGEGDVAEVLYELTFEIPVRVIRIRNLSENYCDSSRNAGPLEINSVDGRKIIIASLVNVEERMRRLRQLGVEERRVVLLS